MISRISTKKSLLRPLDDPAGTPMLDGIDSDIAEADTPDMDMPPPLEPGANGPPPPKDPVTGIPKKPGTEAPIEPGGPEPKSPGIDPSELWNPGISRPGINDDTFIPVPPMEPKITDPTMGEQGGDGPVPTALPGEVPAGDPISDPMGPPPKGPVFPIIPPPNIEPIKPVEEIQPITPIIPETDDRPLDGPQPITPEMLRLLLGGLGPDPVSAGTVSGIDPTNDLRGSSIMPGDDPALTGAYEGIAGSVQGLNAFDRQALLDGLMAKRSGPDVPDIAPGDDLRSTVISDEDDVRTKRYTGAVDTAVGELPSDIVGRSGELRDEYLKKLGSTDIDAGPELDAGPDYAARLNASDTTVQDLAGKVAGGTDRKAIVDDLLEHRGQLFTPETVDAGPEIDLGPSEAGALSRLNTQVGSAADRIANYDRDADVRGKRDELAEYFGDTDVDVGSSIDPTASARSLEYDDMLDASARGLAGVDRSKLALDLFKQFQEARAPEWELQRKRALRDAAATGAIRSGKLRTSYGDIDLARERDTDLEQRRLISDALQASIDDQFRKTGALSGLSDQVSARDAADRAELRGERDFRTSVDAGNVERRLSTRQAASSMAGQDADSGFGSRASVLSSLAGVQSATAAREAGRRGEQRDDRAYRTTVDQSNAAARERARDKTYSAATSEADAGERSLLSALDAARGVSGDLFGRQARRGDTQRADRAFRTGVQEGNVNRRSDSLATATAAGSGLADAESANAMDRLSTLRGIEGDARATNATRIAGRRAERANQFALSDRKRANFESDRANADARGDAAVGDLARRVDANRALFGDIAGESRAQRGEVRGERDYQNLMEDQAFQRRLAQYQAEQAARNQRLNSAVTMLGAGESGNPAETLAGLADSGELDPALLAQLAEIMGSRGGGGNGGPAPGRLPSGVTEVLKNLPIDDLIGKLGGALS